MSTLTDKVDFGLIRYANCWEDADVLLGALSLQPGARVLCIASAGDNALSLLRTAPAAVVAADLSQAQLSLTELKQMAFARLSYGELCTLLGLNPGPERMSLYRHIRKHLSQQAREFWDERSSLIETGIIHAGKFERYFRVFRKYLLPLVHSRKTTRDLLAPKTGQAQSAFYNRHWNNQRWKLLMNLFFSKGIMGKYGRDPEFLKQVTISVPAYIRQKAEEHLQSVYCQDNYLLHMILTGHFGSVLPHYLRPENFESIRQHIGRLSLSAADAGQALREQSFDAYALSNIFEYIPEPAFRELAGEWSDHIPAGARLAYWNLMAPRRLSVVAPELYCAAEPGEDITAPDKGFFYSRFVLEYRK